MQLHSQFTKLIKSMTCTLEQLADLYVKTALCQQHILLQLQDLNR